MALPSNIDVSYSLDAALAHTHRHAQTKVWMHPPTCVCTHTQIYTHMEMRMISCALMVVMWIHQCALTPPRWCGLGRGANSGSSETTLPPACLLGIRRRRHGTHYCCSDTLMLMSPNSTENGYWMLGYASLDCDRVACQTLRDANGP